MEKQLLERAKMGKKIYSETIFYLIEDIALQFKINNCVKKVGKSIEKKFYILIEITNFNS